MSKPGFVYETNFGLLTFGEIGALKVAMQYQISNRRQELWTQIGRNVELGDDNKLHIELVRKQLYSAVSMMYKIDDLYFRMVEAETAYQNKVKEEEAQSLGVVVNGNVQNVTESAIETIYVALEAGFIMDSETRWRFSNGDWIRNDENYEWLNGLMEEAVNWMNDALMPDENTYIGWHESDLMVMCVRCEEDFNSDGTTTPHSTLCNEKTVLDSIDPSWGDFQLDFQLVVQHSLMRLVSAIVLTKRDSTQGKGMLCRSITILAKSRIGKM